VHAERLKRVLVDLEISASNGVSLIIGLQHGAEAIAFATQRKVVHRSYSDHAGYASQVGGICLYRGFVGVVVGDADATDHKDILNIYPCGLADLVYPLLHDVERVDEDREGDRDLCGNERRAGPIAQQRRDDGFHDYWLFR